MRRTIISLILVTLGCGAARAEVKPADLFTDHMVLQQKTTLEIWGTATPSKKVTLTTSWDGATYSDTAGADGGWKVEVTTPSYGGPYTISIAEGRKKPLVLSDILIGEVWLCGGQSNMQMKVWDNVTGMKETLEDAPARTQIRLLHVDTSYGQERKETVKTVGDGWQRCSEESVGQFSAAGYFFGRHLSDSLGVPVGLIESCLGATAIEPWMSAEALSTIPEFARALEALGEIPEDTEARKEKFNRELSEWAAKMSVAEAQTGYDDSSWETMPIPGMIQNLPGHYNFEGFCWLRKTVDIPAEWAGKDLKVRLSVIDDYDFSYYDGVEIGHTEKLSGREYAVPGKLVHPGRTTIAIRLLDSGGLGGIYSGDISVGPEGVTPINLEGEWKMKPLMGLYDEPVFPTNTADNGNIPSLLYNQMIWPLRNYKIKGAVWYQGESNTSRAEKYKSMLPLMISDWRSLWGYDFPFYICQIANYMQEQTGPEESGYALLREAQLIGGTRLDNTGLAVLIDIGEAGDIHPKNKNEAGRRLALNALAGTYGWDIPFSGPVYRDYKVEGKSVRLTFDHNDGGLRLPEGQTELTGFYIAGPDRVFHKASARIDGECVVVSSEEVSVPIAVRYGWANNPVCNLYNGAMLPASPFRTDSFSR